MRPLRVLVLIGMAVVVWACAGEGDAAAGGGDVAPGVATSLQVGVAPSSVELTLHVTNATTEPIVFTFPSGQRHDLWVETASGAEVWRWSEGRSFTQALVTDTLQAGATWRLGAEWDPGEREGPFTAVARLTSREHPLEQRVTFELP